MLLEHQVIGAKAKPRDQITVREKHIPTDLVHGLHRKYQTFYTILWWPDLVTII